MEDQRPIPRLKSSAHFPYISNDTVFLSLDIETGGEYCGKLQLSAELFRIAHCPLQTGKVKKKMDNHPNADFVTHLMNT